MSRMWAKQNCFLPCFATVYSISDLPAYGYTRFRSVSYHMGQKDRRIQFGMSWGSRVKFEWHLYVPFVQSNETASLNNQHEENNQKGAKNHCVLPNDGWALDSAISIEGNQTMIIYPIVWSLRLWRAERAPSLRTFANIDWNYLLPKLLYLLIPIPNS